MIAPAAFLDEISLTCEQKKMTHAADVIAFMTPHDR